MSNRFNPEGAAVVEFRCESCGRIFGAPATVQDFFESVGRVECNECGSDQMESRC